MASSSRALGRLTGPASRQLSVHARAPAVNFSTTSFPRNPTSASTVVARARGRAPVLSRQFTRSYADAAPAPKKKPGKIRRTFRWTWRLTYLSLIAGVGAVIYDGYLDRHPEEQFIPDPQKKTLVILGEYLNLALIILVFHCLTISLRRYRMGLRRSTQEVGHCQLQCRCDFAP